MRPNISADVQDSHQWIAGFPPNLLAQEVDDGLEAIADGDLVEVLLHDRGIAHRLEADGNWGVERERSQARGSRARALWVVSFFLYSPSASSALSNSWLAADARQTAGIPGAEDKGPPVRSDGRTVAMSSVVDMSGAQESRPDCVEAPARRDARRAAGPAAKSARRRLREADSGRPCLLRAGRSFPGARGPRALVRVLPLPRTRPAGWVECNMRSGRTKQGRYWTSVMH
jgi:hypothetical protein